MSVGPDLNSDPGDFAGARGDEDGITTSSLPQGGGIRDGTQDLSPEEPGQPRRPREPTSKIWSQLPDVPRLIEEWAALIPLAFYLSSPRRDHDLAGEVALRGRLSVSAFPKLGALGGIAKMLRQAEVFFDTAGAAGDPLKVYDVQWGSVFPCYNNAAALAVEENAFPGTKTDKPDISMKRLNTWIRHENRESFLSWFEACDDIGLVSEVHCGNSLDDLVERKTNFGRRQLLKVLVVSKLETSYNRRKKLRAITQTTRWKLFELFVSLIFAAALLACRLIGSGLLLAIGAFSRFLLHTVEFKRSALYLRNRETHDGCMLTSLHDNATAWTLYLGHRGMIDSLLNKPMVEPGRAHPIVRWYFEFAEVPQVLAMTYVAAQKGWDGVAFVVLMGLMWASTSLSGNNQHAARWLEEEGFVLDSFTCEFPGRSELLGAVQLLSTEKKTYWMNGILAPVPRREVWLRRIGALDSDTDGDDPDWAS
ncbi:unnamed protein product [Parascedosporium putredinis]|uniref:Uncharacterized protein n=1 Tax=Parascedosporium putredinis TaxID=1442378 RepID=A0A9P1H1K7_9PEZI|nr:unnamed protein product [Parascedosporium putredinis]CAI7993891.1 unnamed protein product [Parascedosporium putredinis]